MDIQWLLGVFVSTLVIIGSLYGGIKFVCMHTFQEALDRFHREAVPSMKALMDSKIRSHSFEVENTINTRIHDIENQSTSIVEKLNFLKEQLENLKGDLSEVDRKLTIVMKNGGSR